jgi:hypothetical protein
MARWPKTMAGEERRGVERKEDTLTDAQALVWMAWRGSARAAGQRLPERVFTTAPPGAPHHRRAHTHTMVSSMKHHRHHREPARWRVQRRQRGKILSEIQPWISSERRRPANPLGGDGRGHGGEQLVHGGGGEARRSRPKLAGVARRRRGD